jgi:ribonuclease BN (tRNA processing enzyme)
MRLWVCGVRGSTPAPGAPFLRYGGHTSCVAIGHDEGPPVLLLDAGTGIRRVDDLFSGAPGLLGDRPFAGSIILGHLHWDHLQGLPFFGAANQAGSRVNLYLPNEGDPGELLDRILAPPFFPITHRQLSGDWRLRSLDEGEHQLEGFSVLAREIPHSTGLSLGLRVADATSAIAYLSDHCPTNLGPGPEGLGEYHQSALELAADCDLLFHDAQYLDEELAERASFGHAAVGYACGLARTAGAKALMLFHHDPPRSDDEIDEIVRRHASNELPVLGAAEGLVIDLPARRIGRFA